MRYIFIEVHQFIVPILMFGGFILFAIISYYYSNKNRLLRAFKKSKRKLINNIKENEYTKVIGKAKHVKEPLVAPLSERLCVYYHIIVEVKGDKHWRKIIDDSRSQDFFIESNSEMAIIKAATIAESMKRIHLVKDYKENSGFRNDASDKLEQYLKSHSKKSTGFFNFNKTIRYSEGIIELNEPIAVKGIANWKSLKEPIEGYSYSKIVTLTGDIKNKLLITDEPEALLRIENRL